MTPATRSRESVLLKRPPHVFIQSLTKYKNIKITWSLHLLLVHVNGHFQVDLMIWGSDVPDQNFGVLGTSHKVVSGMWKCNMDNLCYKKVVTMWLKYGLYVSHVWFIQPHQYDREGPMRGQWESRPQVSCTRPTNSKPPLSTFERCLVKNV